MIALCGCTLVLIGSHNRKVALIVFLCVVGSVFFLLFAATHMRKVMAVDWVPMPEPGLIWVNSLVLVAVSFAFEIARISANSTNSPSALGVFSYLQESVPLYSWSCSS